MSGNKDRQGAAVVEFAVLLVFILLILAGVVEFGFLWLQSHYITNAAREGARVAAKTEDPINSVPDNDAVKKAVTDYLTDLYPNSDRIESIDVTDFNAEETPGYKVEVKVEIIRIFGGTGDWFFKLFAPGDTGNTMTGTAFFANETQ